LKFLSFGVYLKKIYEVCAMKRIILTTTLALIFSVSAFAQNALSNCAKIEVSGGGVIRTGDPMMFTANVTGLTKNSTLEYEWTVSIGTISSGQGTPSITVDTTGLADTNITAEVKIKGLYDNCPNTASETGSITVVCRLPRTFDEFGKISANEVMVRTKNLFIELENSPNSQSYVIIYGTDEEIVKREKQIQKAIRFLKLDANRVTILRGGENLNGGVWTKIYIAPLGAEFPQP